MVKSLTNPFRSRPVPLGTLLAAAHQRLATQLDTSLGAAGFDDLRSSHAAIFMAIDGEGSRLTEVAHRVKMTKQAAGELVAHLVERGYLTVTPDPSDRRAKIIQFTRQGWSAISEGERVITNFDSWLQAAVGAAAVTTLRETLVRISETAPGSREINTSSLDQDSASGQAVGRSKSTRTP